MTKAKLAVLAAEVSARSGGVYEAILGHAQALQRARRPFEILDLTRHPAAPRHDEHALPIRQVPAKGLGFAALRQALTDSDANVLHTHGLWSPAISHCAANWRRTKGRALVISPHGMLDPWALNNGRMKKRLALAVYERRLLTMADCLHALNTAEARALRALGLRSPIAVIPNGVDLPASSKQPVPNSGRDTRKRLLFLGRIHPKKGLQETIEAWAQLLRDVPEMRSLWRLEIAGWDDGGYLGQLRSKVHAMGLSEDVSFTGAVYGAEKQALLSASDAFILASHSEGLPMAVLEAWAHRLPVFMTRACHLPEGFEAGAAIEIPVQPEAMAKLLALHLGAPSLSALGTAGRALVEARFSWQSVGLQLDALYAWLAGERETPPETVLI